MFILLQTKIFYSSTGVKNCYLYTYKLILHGDAETPLLK